MGRRGPGSRGRVSRANRLLPCPFLVLFGVGHSLRTRIRSAALTKKIEIRAGGSGTEGGEGYLSFCSFVLSLFSRVFAVNAQTQLAKYGQLKPGRFLVVVAGHVLFKLAASAQAAGVWCPSRGWYPVGHGNWTALICLDVSWFSNRNCMNFTGRGI